MAADLVALNPSYPSDLSAAVLRRAARADPSSASGSNDAQLADVATAIIAHIRELDRLLKLLKEI